MKINNELITALIKAQTEIESVSKDAKNPAFNSGYATLNAVLLAVKEPLNKNGIYFHQVVSEHDTGVVVETILYGHGGSISNGRVYIPAPKNNPHGCGSALSYARRYSLMLATGVGTTDDDDGNAAVAARLEEHNQAKKVQPKTTVKDPEGSPKKF